MIAPSSINPAVNELWGRTCHTSEFVIAGKSFPFWPQIETRDISTVFDVFKPKFRAPSAGLPAAHEAHVEFKNRVPRAVGLIRSSGAAPYSHLLLEPA